MESTVAVKFSAVALLSLAALPALADQRITCESRNNHYQRCSINQPGYVTLERNLSSSTCRKGRNWDYDRREIWVDDGCRGEFLVHTYGNTHSESHHSDNHDAKVAAGVLVGAAILGAMVHNANKDDAQYRDDNYQGGRHTSYVPSWMVGTFQGYNPMYDAEIRMTVQSDGQVTAVSGNQTLRGWINSGQLHVQDAVFTISQSKNGFTTSQVGDSRNQVHYFRTQ